MLNLTCSVTARYRESDGRRYVLEPVAYHCIVPGVAEPEGIDLSRTHVAVYDQEGSVSPLKLRDLNPARHENGGCLIVLGTLGWLHFNVFLGSGDEPLLTDLDASLVNADLLTSISTDSIFAPSERVSLEQWLAGERYSQDLSLSTEMIPTIGLVRRK